MWLDILASSKNRFLVAQIGSKVFLESVLKRGVFRNHLCISELTVSLVRLHPPEEQLTIN